MHPNFSAIQSLHFTLSGTYADQLA
jgi:hypothetical protein